MQASVTYMTPAMEAIMSTGANARSVCKIPVVVHFISGNRARDCFANFSSGNDEPTEHDGGQSAHSTLASPEAHVRGDSPGADYACSSSCRSS